MKLCPVCRQSVQPTVKHNIAAHMDSIGWTLCRGTGEPYRITVAGKPSTVWVRHDCSGTTTSGGTRV